MPPVLHTAYIAACLALVAWLLLLVAKSKRRLDRRVEQFKREEEERQGAPLDPYAAISELYADDARASEEARRRPKRPPTG